MKKTGFLYDDRYLLHDTGPNHPESPERLKAIKLRKTTWSIPWIWPL